MECLPFFFGGGGGGVLRPNCFSIPLGSWLLSSPAVADALLSLRDVRSELATS